MPFAISHGADIDRARGVILALAGKQLKAVKVGACPLTTFGALGIVLTVDVWCADAFTAITLRSDLLEGVAKQFAADGIAVPYPPTTRFLHDPGVAPATEQLHQT